MPVIRNRILGPSSFVRLFYADHLKSSGQCCYLSVCAGPVLLEDYHLIEKLAQFDRERIPERVVHARGATAKGFFEVCCRLTGSLLVCAHGWQQLYYKSGTVQHMHCSGS